MGYTGGRDVGRQTYANVQYHVGWETYTVSGDYNLPYSEGDDYPIRYSIFNNVSIRTNTFWGLWFDTMVWCVIGFVITTIAFLVDGIVPKDRLVKLTKWKLEFIEVRS